MSELQLFINNKKDIKTVLVWKCTVWRISIGDYTVDGSLHPREDLQLVNGNVIKAPTKTQAQQNNMIYKIKQVNH
jgi:hypothetical protein